MSSQIKGDRRGYSFNSKAFLAGTNRTHNIGTSRRDGAPHAFTVRTTRRYPRKPHAPILHAARVGRETRHLRSDFDFDYGPRMVWRTWNVFRRAGRRLEENHERCPREGRTHVLATLACRSLVTRLHDQRRNACGAFGHSGIRADFTPSVSTPSGWFKPSPHRALGISEIPGIVEDYRKAAERAKAAGFDGVELHAANGYLIDEFLQDGSNKRTDAYGGSVENRSRLLLEVVEALVSVWGDNRVAVRIGPGGTWNSMSDSNPAALFDYVAEQLNRFALAYLHIIEPRIKGNVLVAEGQEPVATAQLRKIFKGKIIAAGGFEPDTAEAIVEKGDADLVAFGRHFLANPDLPKRIRLGLPLNDYDRKTFYTFDFHGYTDYPFYDQRREGLLSDPFCPQLHDSAFYFDSRLHAGLAQASAITSSRSESKNKALVLEAFETLFNKPGASGRDGLFNLIKSIPPTLKYEPGVIVANEDFVIVHGRFSGFGQPVNWIAADILRIKDGVLVEHWDVIQDEATQEQSKSGHPMFGDKFPK